MYSLILIFVGTFWEVGMDIVGHRHNYVRSHWWRLAAWAEARGLQRLGHNFWDHSIAWTRKWRDGDPQRGPRFPGSTTWLVTVVDGWHLLKFLWLMHVCLAIVLYTPLTPWWPLDALLGYITFGLGHECWWRLMLRRHAALQAP